MQAYYEDYLEMKKDTLEELKALDESLSEIMMILTSLGSPPKDMDMEAIREKIWKEYVSPHVEAEKTRKEQPAKETQVDAGGATEKCNREGSGEDETEMLKDAIHKAHVPDCKCGQCTGEDRALELMEEGICRAENSFGDD